MSIDPQHRRHHLPGRLIRSRRNGSQGKAIDQLDGSFQVLGVGPSLSDSTPDGRLLAAKLLYLDLPNDMSGPDAYCRVSVARCKPCTNPHDTTDLPRYNPTGLIQYVLNNYTTNPPPFHVTADDVSVPVERLEVDKISSHRSIRGRGGAIAVLYETHWKGLLRPSWEREADLLHARQHILEYWAGATLQLRQTNQVHRRMRVGATQRELARDKRARFLPPGYSYVNHQMWARRFRDTILLVAAYFWYKGQDNLWWLGNISAHTPTPGQYVAFWTTPDQSSSRSLLIATVRLLGSFVARGVYKCIKEALSCVVLCATSTSPAELN